MQNKKNPLDVEKFVQCPLNSPAHRERYKCSQLAFSINPGLGLQNSGNFQSWKHSMGIIGNLWELTGINRNKRENPGNLQHLRLALNRGLKYSWQKYIVA